jgi:phospholipase A2
VLLAESWAKLNHVPFPPVSRIVEKYQQEPVREWYLFEDPTDPYCPVILHFIILNKEFKKFKAPGKLF